MITHADLEAAPVGSQLVRDYGHGVKHVLHKEADGFWHPRYRWGCDFYRLLAADVDLSRGPKVTLHHPAPVRVRSVWNGWRGERWWFWTCTGCIDGVGPFRDPGLCHDLAREHVKGHAEMSLPC